MQQAVGTLADYSRSVIELYRRKQAETPDPVARACLELAIKQESRLRSGLVEAVGGLSSKQQSAQFKWHDKWQLVNVARLYEHSVKDVDDVLSLVIECDERARAYCAGLTASTNSPEVLHMLELLEETRSQHLREYTWQVSRA